MLTRGGPFWLLCALGLLSALGSACKRRQTVATAPPPQPATSTVPAPRAPGDFVRSPRHVTLAASEVRLPIELVTYMPYLTLTSPDGSRRRAIFDTGADTVLVSPALVAAHHLTTRPSDRTFRDASGTRPGTATAIVDRLDLGPVQFEDFDAGVEDLYAGADALLGWPLWRALLVTIDYPHQTLILTQGSLPPPDSRQILPLRLDDNRLMVRATLDGRETWLNLDTGWGVGDSVELTDATAAKVSWASAPVPTMATNTAQGVAVQKLGRLKGDLQLGRYRIVQPVAGTNGGLAADLLASVALSHFTVTLDLRNLRARFDRPTADPILPEPVFVAGFDCDLRSNPLKVTGVLPASAADRAGLRAGDLLLTVDGRPALDGLLAHTGDAFKMEVRRGDKTWTLTVPMTRLVP